MVEDTGTVEALAEVKEWLIIEPLLLTVVALT